MNYKRQRARRRAIPKIFSWKVGVETEKVLVVGCKRRRERIHSANTLN